MEALTEIPEVSPSRMAADMASLLEAADEHDDLHDTICRVGGQHFVLHSFVLAGGSETLAKQLQFAEAVSPTVIDIDDIQPVIFEQVVRYLYTRSCDLLVAGPCKVVLEVDKKAGQDAKSDDNENFISVEGDPYAVSAFAAYTDQQRGGGRGGGKKKAAAKRPNGPQQQAGDVTPSGALMQIQMVLLFDYFALKEQDACKR